MPWSSNELYKVLNGLVSLYKPLNCTLTKFSELVQFYLAKGFNSLPSENQKIVTEVIRNSSDAKVIQVEDIFSLPEVRGPNFHPTDFEMYAVNPLPKFASGVQVVGIGPVGLALSAKMFEENSYLSVYRMTCMMGRSTYSGTPESNTIVRTSWRNVTESKLEYILKNRLHHYINLSYVGAGLAPNSQAAYDAMCRSSGLIRPKAISSEDRDNHESVRKPSAFIYGLNCVKFEPPFFTIEMHVINEDIDFIIGFMRDISGKLRTGLVLTQLRRIRHGRFTAELSMLLRDFKSFDPDTLADHLDMTNSHHSFESLQLDQKNVLLVPGGDVSTPLVGHGGVNPGNKRLK